jgi:hypothetical protein
MTETVAELGAMVKSGTAATTGARTEGVAATVTVMSVVCEIAPSVAVTESV